MLDMATKRNKPVDKAPSPKRTGRPINIWIDDSLSDAVEGYVKATRPKTTLTAVIELALEEYLTKHHFWPPSNSD